MDVSIFLLFFFCLACAALGSSLLLFLVIRSRPRGAGAGGTAPQSPPVQATTVLTDGGLYTLSKDGVFLANDFDKRRPKGKMCNASTSSAASGASRLKLTKDGDQWIVATDCDGDGSYTSYLTRGSDLIEAKKADTKLQRWSIACEPGGCTFGNGSTYLAGSFTSPSWSSVPSKYAFVTL